MENHTDFNEIIDKKKIKQYRHKSEKRWYIALVIINILIIGSVISVFTYNFKENYKNIKESIVETYNNPDTAESDIENIPTDVKILCYGLLIFLILPFSVNFMYAGIRSRAIRITERNFPDVYERIVKYSHILGLKKVPEAYIVQENGVLNAFSAFIIRKQYIQINADLFEIAYREHHDLDSISFVIAHELSHIKLKHATFLYHISILYSSVIPILGSTASRAREYSCDRLAQKVTGNSGIEAMLSLMAGKHLYKDVDIEDYLNHANEVKGFFVWCYNLSSSHPIMTKRIKALEMEEGSGQLY